MTQKQSKIALEHGLGSRYLAGGDVFLVTN